MMVADYDGLYYPYVHVRSAKWLKLNLLLFPTIWRMVPEGFNTKDDPEIAQFARASGTRGSLLQRAPPHSGEVFKAVNQLHGRFEERLNRDGKAKLVKRFGEAAAGKLKTKTNPHGFQYQVKKAQQLSEFLLKNQLAWGARYEEPHYPAEYVEVHPHVGEAIMTTLALACARDLGSQIVTDNGKLHRCLAESDLESVFDTWVDQGGESAHAEDKQYERKLTIAVFEHLDVSAVTPASIAALHKEWEPRQRFLRHIRDIAASIPPIENAALQQERIQTAADTAIREWERDKLSLGSVIRNMFPSASAGALKDAYKDLARGLAAPAAGAATAFFASPDWMSIAGGVAIGIVAEGIKGVAASVDSAKSSPYRFLSLVEKAGVKFTVSK